MLKRSSICHWLDIYKQPVALTFTPTSNLQSTIDLRKDGRNLEKNCQGREAGGEQGGRGGGEAGADLTETLGWQG